MLCRKISHSPSHRAQEKALIARPEQGAPTTLLPAAPAPLGTLQAPLQGCLRLPAALATRTTANAPRKESHQLGKKQQHPPPSTQRSSTLTCIAPLSFNCRYTGAVRWRVYMVRRHSEVQSLCTKLSETCRSQIIPLSPMDANTAVMTVVSLFSLLPTCFPTSLCHAEEH